MNRNRRSGVAGAPTKYKQAVDCIDCSKPMVLRRNSRDGTLFYSHPRGTALGCTQTYEAEFYEQARVEAAELRHGASQPSKPRPGWCQRCGKVRSGTAELCACCQQDDLARKLTGGDADA